MLHRGRQLINRKLTRYKGVDTHLAGLLAVLGKGAPLLFAELGCKHSIYILILDKQNSKSQSCRKQPVCSISPGVIHTYVCGCCSGVCRQAATT